MGSRSLHGFSRELIIPTPTLRLESVPSTELRLIFNFCGTHQYCQWILRRNSMELELLGERWLYSPSKQIQFKPQFTLMSKEKMFRALSRGLIGFRLPIPARRNLAEWAAEEAWNILVSSMNQPNNQMNLDIDFNVVHQLVRYESRVIQETVVEPESAGPNMIPSSEASIESLESKIVDPLHGNTASCSICLDDFEAGCEGVFMPCSHVFHGGCIKRWLRASHYCPVCRFQMPTSLTS